jgi:putative ABC transport system ATP-binding protein
MLSLSVRGLEVRFPGLAVPALSIDALDLPAGAHVAVAGPSGSGKTTLVNVLAGLQMGQSGSVVWQDSDIARLSESQRDQWRATNVGLVMQDFHLFPGLSALDNVLLPLRLRQPRNAKLFVARARELLAQVGITREKQMVETLSRGQMQRVAVARALLASPGLIVADEPTASLDADAGAAVVELLVSLAKVTQATLVVVSHDPRVVARMHRTLVLRDGQLVESEAVTC